MKNSVLNLIKYFEATLWMLVCLLLISVLSSCQKDKDQPVPEPNPTGKQLKKIDFGGGAFYSYIYNTNGQLTKLSQVIPEAGAQNFEYEYLNATTQKIKKMIYDGSDFFDYQYDANGRLIKVEQKDGLGEVYNVYEYKYNTQGRLIEIVGKPAGEFSFGVVRQVLKYNEDTGNMTELKTENYNLETDEFEAVTTMLYENFDNKKNVESKFLIYPNFLHLDLHVNNPRKITIKDELGFVVGSNTYTYEYNAEGYPTKAIVTVAYQNEEPITGSYKLTYF